MKNLKKFNLKAMAVITVLMLVATACQEEYTCEDIYGEDSEECTRSRSNGTIANPENIYFGTVSEEANLDMRSDVYWYHYLLNGDTISIKKTLKTDSAVAKMEYYIDGVLAATNENGANKKELNIFHVVKGKNTGDTVTGSLYVYLQSGKILKDYYKKKDVYIVSDKRVDFTLYHHNDYYDDRIMSNGDTVVVVLDSLRIFPEGAMHLWKCFVEIRNSSTGAWAYLYKSEEYPVYEYPYKIECILNNIPQGEYYLTFGSVFYGQAAGRSCTESYHMGIITVK